METSASPEHHQPVPNTSTQAASAAGHTRLLSTGLTILILALALLNMGVRNLPWHLDDYDQSKQAYVSFEMVERGNWFLQHTPRQGIATKPPLMGWISAGLYYLTHWWEISWRIPSLVSALVLLFLLKREGDKRFVVPVGILVAAVFALNLLTPRVATLVRTDMMLTLAIFIPGWLIWRKILSRTEWTTGERWAIFASVLAGVLTKGPVLYAFLLPGVVAFLFLGKESRRYVWCGWWPWVIPLAIFLAWVWANIHNEEFYKQVVEKEFMGRFTSGEKAVHRSQPVYYYVMHLTVRLAPWSLLLLVLLAKTQTRTWLRANSGTIWLLCWALGALLFMSVIPSKRTDRIFPIIPPLSLALGAMCAMWIERGGHWGKWSAAKWFTAVIWLAVVASLGYSVANMYDQFRQPTDATARFGERVRAHAAPGNLRIASTPAGHEATLLYLRIPEFTPTPRAIRDFTQGKVDLLVLSREEYDQSPDKDTWEILESLDVTESKDTYVCVRRKPQ
jgi:4-amino-4-deoxy-L-arabinose transferase-like glycosyltransferase